MPSSCVEHLRWRHSNPLWYSGSRKCAATCFFRISFRGIGRIRVSYVNSSLLMQMRHTGCESIMGYEHGYWTGLPSSASNVPNSSLTWTLWGFSVKRDTSNRWVIRDIPKTVSGLLSLAHDKCVVTLKYKKVCLVSFRSFALRGFLSTT